MTKIEEIVKKIGILDEKAMAKVRERQDKLTKPQGSLGRLEDLSAQIAGIRGESLPRIKNKVIITMAGDHGITDESVSAYPGEVTPQMVYNFLSGGAGINVFSRFVEAKVVIVDMGVCTDLEENKDLVVRKINYGTRNFLKEPAMTREEAKKAIEAGMEIAENEITKGADIIGTGDMGIGNTTSSSAITAAITGASVSEVTGRGTGIDDEQLKHKVEVIEKSLNLHKPDAMDPLDVLSKVGGFEIGGIAGVILAGAAMRIPVVIDGFISGAGALIADKFSDKCRNFMIASHCSYEKGHQVILEWLSLNPLLNFNMRLGEGTGAALGISIIEASLKLLSEMATFEKAGVSEKLD